ncbi:hypothetical protein [Pararhizobium sp.]|uniref:hypothetical protein n=1 Tax=Pararhizobium sp. TaxID=1977563 RepID=UPI00271D7191|nr:hypothetical protein [Pararhizobium sp.]MDO9418727.1 hypothetical protein [Pararhizobium sp.]
MFFNTKLMEEMSVLWFQAPAVASARMQTMTMSAMTGGLQDPREMTRMISEKFAAVAESFEAMGQAMLSEGMGASAAMASGKCGMLEGAAGRVASATIEPYVKRVRANASRLTK